MPSLIKLSVMPQAEYIFLSLIPLFWLILTVAIPRIFPKSLFQKKANYNIVRLAALVVFFLFLDSLYWAVSTGLDIYRESENYPQIFRSWTIGAISKVLLLVSGLAFYYFMQRSAGLISTSFANLRKVNAQLVSSNLDLEAVSKKIEALVDFGKELNTKIYEGEAAIQDFIQEKADNFMNTENMYIAMYDSETDEVMFPLFYKNGTRSNIPSRKAGHGRTEEIIQTGDSILIRNRKESQAWYQQPGRTEYIGDELSSWIGVPMKDSESKVLGVVATYHPIEDNLYDEDDLRVLESMADLAVIAIENARLVRSLKMVQTEIAERERELVTSGFAMDFTHKINNLIGPMQPWIQLLNRQLSEESKGKERVQKIVERINQDIGMILKEAKQLREPVTDPEPIDLETLILGILGQVELLADENVNIHFEKKASVPTVEGLKQQLSVAVYSIIQNGLKALKEGGDLIITLDQDKVGNQEFARIIIRDNGIGIDQSKRNLIFEFGATFWQHRRGTGYGLWRAKNVIQNFGGTLDLTYTELGKGTAFTIQIPLTEYTLQP